MPYANKNDRVKADKARYDANADAVKTQRREWYRDHRQEVRAQRAALSPKHLAKNAKRERDRYAALRLEILAAYGGRCECCGESEPIFLDLDHVNNDGSEHRRKIGRATKTLYAWLKKKGFPHDGFRLLCSNCNQGRKRNGGECPHRATRAVLRADDQGTLGW